MMGGGTGGIAVAMRGGVAELAMAVPAQAKIGPSRAQHACGRRHPIWTQDHGRARCMGQLHRTSLVAEWLTVAGTDIDATVRCARATLRVLDSAAWRCGKGHGFTSVAMAWIYAGYASGLSCTATRESERRAHRWIAVRGRIQAEMWKQQEAGK